MTPKKLKACDYGKDYYCTCVHVHVKSTVYTCTCTFINYNNNLSHAPLNNIDKCDYTSTCTCTD